MKKFLTVLGMFGLLFALSCNQSEQKAPEAAPAVEEEVTAPADTMKVEADSKEAEQAATE